MLFVAKFNWFSFPSWGPLSPTLFSFRLQAKVLRIRGDKRQKKTRVQKKHTVPDQFAPHHYH